VIGAGSLRKFGKEAREVGMRLDAVCLCRFDQRVQAGTRGGADGGLTEEPVFPSDTKWSDRVLDTVGIKRNLRTIEERQELAPLAQHVEHRLAECALREHSVSHLVEPGLELRHDRRGLGLPNAESFLSRRSFDLSLDAIQLPDQIQCDLGLPIATRVSLRLARVLEPATGVGLMRSTG
jgi:hypothetical protein